MTIITVASFLAILATDSITLTAVRESIPEVGSSKKSRARFVISSMAMGVFFLSPFVNLLLCDFFTSDS